MQTQNEAVIGVSVRQFVKVAPPTTHAGIGDALRQAFTLNGDKKTPPMFEELLSRLD